MNNIIFSIGDINKLDAQAIILNCKSIAIDTETTGLNPKEAEMKLLQIYTDTNKFFLIRIDKRRKYKNLAKVLNNPSIIKIFHNAIFDMKFIEKTFRDIHISNIRCTKISEKIIINNTTNTSLKNLLNKYLDVHLDKKEQTSNWSSIKYTKAQVDYAINDVRFLLELWTKQESILIKTQQLRLARECFNFIRTQILLEKIGLKNVFQY